MSKRSGNSYENLVDDLVANRLTLLMVESAIKESVRRNPRIPEGVKNIVAPHNQIKNHSIKFTGKDEAATFYFKHCPKCGRKL